ncbi:MAG: hypothetical protein IJ578_02130 [Bacteroidales bacterium]|nr:hypothetical protein [Bacteroidales bacterium]
MRLKRNIARLLLPVLVLTACDGWNADKESIRNVCIIYSAGYNNLSPDLTEDLNDLATKGYVPKKKAQDVLLVASRRTADAKGADYKTPTAAYLYRLYKHNNKLVRDTLFALQEGVSMLEADAMRTLLGKARDLYPSDHYGMVFTSHGNGWLPSGFYANPGSAPKSSGQRRARRIEAPDNFPLYGTPGVIRTKSLGPEFYYEPEGTTRLSTEMDIDDMAAAIPMHLDYLLFDACLMGGVEVAWALREVADYVGFSQAEVLTDGFDYTTLASHLLQATPDPTAVCDDFYQYYEKQSKESHSATISLIRTGELASLAQACKPLFEMYRAEISKLKTSGVQGFGGTKHYFYDLADILAKAGASAEEMTGVQAALDRCVAYKATTGQYYSVYGGSFEIKAFCGLSMYLPSTNAVSTGKAYLDEYYRTLGWNQAAELVK